MFACETFAGCFPVLERLAAGEEPDVLVLDRELPGMTGLEACRFIRTTRDEVSLPILLVTARTESAEAVEGLSAGANDYLRKPWADAELLERVRVLSRTRALYLRGRQTERQLGTILRSIGDAVISTDASAVVRFMNPVASALTG